MGRVGARPIARRPPAAGEAPHNPLMVPRNEWSDRSEELSQLLSRCGLGDRAAFARLYQLSSAHLFAVILRINRDRAIAEDLLQEVYVNVWRAAKGFDAAQSQPMTWLTSIARNRAIDSLRRAQAQPRLHSGHAQDDEDSDVYDETADEAAGPLELLSQASDARQLHRCMEGLGAPQRQSLALAYYDGLSHAEVADRLGQPLGTVKSWVRRSLQALKACLDQAVQADAARTGRRA